MWFLVFDARVLQDARERIVSALEKLGLRTFRARSRDETKLFVLVGARIKTVG